ncbi:reprolysin-like metallopeptidase, partial [Candidatus Viridilinea mediisalina]
MNTLLRFTIYTLALVCLSLMALGLPVRSQDGALPAAESRFWREAAGVGLAAEAPAAAPLRYRSLVAVEEQLDAVLALAPHEHSDDAWTRAVLLDLPLPEGGMASFAFVNSPVMAPELAARYPELQTYLGRQQDDPAVLARLTRSPAGYHALVLQHNDSFFVAPYAQADRGVHLVYANNAATRGTLERDPPLRPATLALPLAQPRGAYGGDLRVFRLAASATGEFTQASGGTKETALATIVQVLNAVNAIYERDLSVRLELIANTDELIYTNPATDPFPPNRSDMTEANQQTVDAVIGSANYDLGHLFSSTAGGFAMLNSACKDGIKARSTSGTGPTILMDMIVGTVAHELGHQFGANHSFNSVAGFCQYGREAASAYEPGSGSTIMSYAGICDAENLQDQEDLVFHIHNLIEMSSYLQEDVDSCGLTLARGNRPPLVSAGPNSTIPANTPFELIGTASDPDGDSLSFSWEQYDLGAASPPLSDDGSRPLFRSFMPGPSPARTFPQVADILSGQETIGETLPTTNRQLNFRFVVRDNHPGAGAFAYDTTT